MAKKAFSSRKSTSRKQPASSRAATRRSATAPNRIRIGISGWRYAPWRGVFYPKHLPQKHELEYAASKFSTIEINGSFYSLQRRESWQRWYAETPEDFLFAVKGPRYVTHMLRLRNVEQPLANFLASGILALNEKLGPILWQFPPQMRFDRDRFETFLALLPRDNEAALDRARQHDSRMEERSYLAIDTVRPMRYAMEVRHPSFLDAQFIELLRAHNVALVVAETARKWPMPVDVTADFVYARLHGDATLYQSGYGPKAINRWAERFVTWSRGREPEDLPEGAVRVGAPSHVVPAGRDVFCYFDNTDVKLRAPVDARSLMRTLGLEPRRDAEAQALN